MSDARIYEMRVHRRIGDAFSICLSDEPDQRYYAVRQKNPSFCIGADSEDAAIAQGANTLAAFAELQREVLADEAAHDRAVAAIRSQLARDLPGHTLDLDGIVQNVVRTYLAAGGNLRKILVTTLRECRVHILALDARDPDPDTADVIERIDAAIETASRPRVGA